MGISLPALSQNGPPKLVICIFCDQSTAPPPHSSLITVVVEKVKLVTMKSSFEIGMGQIRLWDIQ